MLQVSANLSVIENQKSLGSNAALSPLLHFSYSKRGGYGNITYFCVK